MKKVVWDIGVPDETAQAKEEINTISESLGIGKVLAGILYERGCHSPQEALAFICMDDAVIGNPFSMKGMRAAAERIFEAVNQHEGIAVYGDYDLDGISATATLFLYLEEWDPTLELGYYIPDRFGEGYGVNRAALDKIKQKNASLVITVDTGISAADEAEYARQIGLDMVITDHHECPEVLPAASAVVDPHQPDCPYPFRDLAGVGVALKLVEALEYLRRGEGADWREIHTAIFEKYADLAALGTVADVMPLVGENRMIVAYGLGRINHSSRPGIMALLGKATSGRMTPVTSTTISYTLAPRLNAAGRMSKATLALELLLLSKTDASALQSAEYIAGLLCDLNKERQQEEARIIEEAGDVVARNHDLEKDKFIVADGEDWHLGVIGIVSSRLTEQYYLPSVMISYLDMSSDEKKPGDVGKGSGRSVEGINLVKALESCKDLLIKYGGHNQAAGFSVLRENVPELRRRLCGFAASAPESVWQQSEKVDMELSASDVTMQNAAELQKLEPYGCANPTPLFCLSDAKITRSYPIGNGKHLKLTLEKDGVFLDGVMFNADYEAFNMGVGRRVDILFNMEINEYGGISSVQMILRSMRESTRMEENFASWEAEYAAICEGGEIQNPGDAIPERDDFAKVYTFLRSSSLSGKSAMPERQLFAMLGGEERISFVKFRFVLDILNEMKLCEIAKDDRGTVFFSVDPTARRVDLNTSELLKKLRSRCQ